MRTESPRGYAERRKEQTPFGVTTLGVLPVDVAGLLDAVGRTKELKRDRPNTCPGQTCMLPVEVGAFWLVRWVIPALTMVGASSPTCSLMPVSRALFAESC